MKIAPFFDKKDDASSSSRKVNLPPIPFERAEVGELKKGAYASMKLRNNPGDPDSPGYDIHVKYFKEGSCEEFLTFETDLKRVFAGQAATTGPLKFATARRLLDGAALTTFNLALPAGATETLPTFDACLEAVRASVFPYQAASNQRRYLRRVLRKKADVTVKQFVDRVLELNNYLARFPPTTVGGPEPDILSDEDVMELLEFGVPNSWRNQMTMQGFIPKQHTVQEFIEVCQRYEQVESRDGTANNQPSKNQTNGKNGKKRSSNGKEKSFGKKQEIVNGVRMCPIHNYSHPLQDCKVLMAQAKRMKGMYEAAGPEGRRKIKEHELNAMDNLDKIVEKAVAERFKQAHKKIKFDKKVRDEIHAFEQLDISDSDTSNTNKQPGEDAASSDSE